MTEAVQAQALVDLLPQKPPFRFVDEVAEVDANRIVSRYRFRGDEFFYAGHFPGEPVTPGVILGEAMAQGGVALHAAYLLSLELGFERARRCKTLLTDMQLEFLRPVYPAQTVSICGELVWYRRRKLRSRVSLIDAEGRIAASGVISGVGAPRE